MYHAICDRPGPMGPLPMWQMLRDRCLLKWRRGEVAKWRISMISTVWVMSSLWLFSHLEVVYGVHHQVCAEGSFTVPQSGVGDGVGWFIKVHVHVHTSSTLTSHLVILDDTSVFQGSTQNISQREVGLSALNHPDLSSWWLQPQKKRPSVRTVIQERSKNDTCLQPPTSQGRLAGYSWV